MPWRRALACRRPGGGVPVLPAPRAQGR